MEEKIYTKFNSAVRAAAEQNFERDVRLGVVTMLEKAEVFDDYIKDATNLLSRDSRNSTPYYSDHSQIVFTKSDSGDSNAFTS